MKIRTTVWLVLAMSLASSGCRRKEAAPPRRLEAAGAPSFMVFELPVGDRTFENRLVRGFYEVGQGWRWTARQWAVSLDAPPPLDAATFLELDFAAPVELMKEMHDVTLTARVNGQQVGTQKYTAEGRYLLNFDVPPALLKRSPALVEVALDKAGKDPETGREIGLIVVGVALKHPDATIIGHDAASELARQGYLQLLKQRQMTMTPEKQNELIKLFHQIPIWRQMWFQNAQIEKNPLDLWMMQQIIYEVQPDFVIETGTWRGGSALYWAHTLNGMGLENSRVLTVDIGDYKSTAETHPLWKKYVTYFKGSSTEPAIVAEITRRVKGHKAVVTLDSDHTMKHVLEELHAYAPLVTRGSYLVVEDTHMDGVPTQPNLGPGPLAAVLQFLKEKEGRDFVQDFSREALIMTFNPGGWLRRK